MLKMLAGISQHACSAMKMKSATVRGSVDQLTQETDIHTIAVALDRELSDTTAPSSAPVHAYAVAASLMNLPASDAGSRCLLSDTATH